MTRWMIQHFVKDYEKTDNIKVRTAYGVLGSCVAMGCNLVLFAVKFVLGAMLHSVSVLADAFNDLSDTVSNIIGLVGVKMAEKPADKNHPFGHGRMEYIAAMIVAFLVVEVGITFLKESVHKILHPQKMAFQWVAMAGLLFSVAVKLWMAYFNRKLGKTIHSKVMEATAVDAVGDVLATLVTAVSLLVYRLFQINIDGWAGLLVSLLIIWAGISIVMDASKPLLGGPADPQQYRRIKEFVEKYEGIRGTHDLIIHNYGPANSMASIHAEVSDRENIVRCHELIDRIERDASRKLGIMLLIHTDPLELDSRELTAAREKVTALLGTLDERLTIHDFRMIRENEVIRLIFDMAVPYEFHQEQEEALQKKLEELLRQEDPRYRCEITYDKSFVEIEE